MEREWLGAYVRTPAGEVGQVWSVANPGSYYQGSAAYRGDVWVVLAGADGNYLRAISTGFLVRLHGAQPVLDFRTRSSGLGAVAGRVPRVCSVCGHPMPPVRPPPERDGRLVCRW